MDEHAERPDVPALMEHQVLHFSPKWQTQPCL